MCATQQLTLFKQLFKFTCLNNYLSLNNCLNLFLILSFIHKNKKNTRNNYRNIFVALGALKSLHSFPLHIDVNDILNYPTNYILRKSRKKAIQGCLRKHLLIVTFHEVAIKYELEVKPQLVLLDISTNHNVKSLHFRFCQNGLFI